MYQGKYSQNAQSDPPEARRRRMPRSRAKNSRGTVLFYSIYGAFVAVAIIAILCLMNPLRSWLVRYEASQPEQRAAEVFDQLFKDPDWAALYTQAQAQDSAFDGKEAYAAYMEEKAASAELTYIETSAGLSGDHKYIVRLGDEKIATFTLTGGTDSQTDISTWELGSVELFFERSQSAIIEKLPEYTVTVNGIALDDSHIIRTVSTQAEEYLPDGIHGYRMEQLYVDGLLSQPEISVLDASGNAVTMVQDPETGIWKPQSAASAEMTEEEKALVLGAAKADAAFSIRGITSTELRKYFDANSQVYEDITGSRSLIQNHQGYSFDETVTEVSDFYRYSDTLFSANVKLKMDVVRKNGSIKEFYVDKTYFLSQNASGNYLVTQYTNVPVQEPVEQVRLTFFNNGERLGSQMVASTATSLTLPQITAPEGQVLQGWAIREDDGSGKITMTIVFTPSETGVIYLSSDKALEPMALYAVFGTEEVSQ